MVVVHSAILKRKHVHEYTQISLNIPKTVAANRTFVVTAIFVLITNHMTIVSRDKPCDGSGLVRRERLITRPTPVRLGFKEVFR